MQGTGCNIVLVSGAALAIQPSFPLSISSYLVDGCP